MPLNLSVNSGEGFAPYIKYNAKAGRWYAKVDKAEVEIMNPRLAFDFANIKTGWLYYMEGMGPQKTWDLSRTEMAPCPSPNHKRGFEVMVLGGDNIPGVGPLGLREFSSTAGAVITPILTMYQDYEFGQTEHHGKVPFYGCTGVTALSGVHGTNYEPNFRLIAWVERARLPAFDEQASKQPATSMIAQTGIDPTVPLPAGPEAGAYSPTAPLPPGMEPIDNVLPTTGQIIGDGIPFAPWVW